MKIRFNGTAAAEGFPALFCNCKHCNDARTLGGKNIRRRTSVLINNEYMIDFSNDVYSSTLTEGLDISKVRHLFITHSHIDHLNTSDLILRNYGFAYCDKNDPIYLYANQYVIDKIRYENRNESASFEKYIKLISIEPYEVINTGNAKVISLPANHYTCEEETPLIYYIEIDGKGYFHGLDTGLFDENNYKFLKEHNAKIDIAALDCCFCNMPSFGNHMGIDSCNQVKKKLLKYNLANDNTKFVITHFSHNGRPIHSELEDIAKKYSFIVAYDNFICE